MHSHNVLSDLAYPEIPIAGNAAQQPLRPGPGDAVDADIALGSTVLGLCGETVGTVAEVYVDNQTGQSDWATVTIARHRCLVPLSEARVAGDTVWVGVTAEQVRAAPHRDPAAALTVEDKHDLSLYFGLTEPPSPSAGSVPPKARVLGGAARTATRHRHANRDRDRDRGHNTPRNRIGAVRLCPPEALRC